MTNIIKTLIESQNTTASDYWVWNGTEFVISLGNLIALIQENNGGQE